MNACESRQREGERGSSREQNECSRRGKNPVERNSMGNSIGNREKTRWERENEKVYGKMH